MPPIEDVTLDEDILAVRVEAQKAVDREIAARAELAAAIENRVAVRAKIAAGDADALAFIDGYVNPVVAAPPPIAPEVAAPPLAVEPPVFTTVEDANVSADNSSGGVSVVADELVVVPAAPAGEGVDAAGGAAAATE